ncbi:MAG TPA: hypothetical protein VGM53_32495 [Streptosporangiaceae bacterium]|jgi:hypothetical protein
MAQIPRDTDAIQASRARNTLIRTVRALLKGTGLDIRELTNHLVISHRGHPDHGRIYVPYANGDGSLRRCTWDYLGHFDGYVSSDPEAEPPLTAEKIIATLTGQTHRPS